MDISCGIVSEKEENYTPEFDVKEVERNLITKYRKKIWSPFTKAVNEYTLIEDGDHIAVCISGGKDSLILSKLLQEMQKYSKINFKLSFIAMNPGFNKVNLENLKKNCHALNIEVEIFETKIFDVVGKIASDYPCYLCSKMRRGSLYDYAQQLGCNKIALGHHFDDVIETTLINMFYAGSYKTMLPKLKSTNYENMQLIRPMVNIREHDIINFTKYHNILAMNCGCVVAAKTTSSKRSEVKEIIAHLKKTNDNIEKSIFSSAKNVNIDAVYGYQKDNKKFDAINPE